MDRYRCVRCGGDGTSTQQDHLPPRFQGECALSYIAAEAGFICTICLTTELLKPMRKQSDSQSTWTPTTTDDTTVHFTISKLKDRLRRARKRESIHGPVEEPALEALVGIITEAREIGEQLSGKFCTGSVHNLKFAEIAMNVALQACDELPRDFEYGDVLGIHHGQLPDPWILEEMGGSDVLGCTRSHFVGVAVCELARVCFALGSWTHAAAACRCALEAEGPVIKLPDLQFIRRVCCTTASRPSSMQQQLENLPDFRDYRTGWFEPAVRPNIPGAEVQERFAAAMKRGPMTHAWLVEYINQGGIDDALTSEWQHSVQSFCPTEAGFRCLGCGAAGPDCICKSEVQEFTPPPLHFELTGAFSVGSSVRICNLVSSEGQKLNGSYGEVVSINEGGCGRLGVKIHEQGVNKAIKGENLKCTLLSKSQVSSLNAELIDWKPRASAGTSESFSSSVSIVSAAGSKCYLPGSTCFRCPDGTFVGVEEIEQHEMLVGHGGVQVEVVKAICHESEDRELMLLQTSDSAVIVTSDHPIVVPRGESGQSQSIPAGHLKVNDTILCANGEHKLIEVKRWVESTRVYQLSFHPDVPMETFYTMANPILTKGSKINKTRRGGMKKARPDMPETFDGSWK